MARDTNVGKWSTNRVKFFVFVSAVHSDTKILSYSISSRVFFEGDDVEAEEEAERDRRDRFIGRKERLKERCNPFGVCINICIIIILVL